MRERRKKKWNVNRMSRKEWLKTLYWSKSKVDSDRILKKVKEEDCDD